MRIAEPKTIFVFILLLAGAGGSTYLASDFWSTDETRAKPELSLAYYLDSAELIGTGEDGEILYQVRAKRAEQTVGDDSVSINDVQMTYGPKQGLPWELSAREGRIPADASIVILMGDVVAVSGDTPETATTIRTQQIAINPHTLIATTQKKVVIEYSGRQINATGMKADFEANRLNLLSNVNGKFIP
jgi:LPS export ABC transporter protein LptC